MKANAIGPYWENFQIFSRMHMIGTPYHAIKKHDYCQTGSVGILGKFRLFSTSYSQHFSLPNTAGGFRVLYMKASEMKDGLGHSLRSFMHH